jgi:diacylglycerol O-acyltransferase / wax synthase
MKIGSLWGATREKGTVDAALRLTQPMPTGDAVAEVSSMPERLSVLDNSFLQLETTANHFHVGGLAILDPSTRPQGKLTIEDIGELIDRRMHLVPRFRQKIVQVPFNLGRPLWVDDANFDMEFHLRRAALPAPGGRRELADYVQRVHSRPLDRSKSLWEMYLIEGLEDGHIAVLSKIHHAMIDGMSGIDIATVLYDFTPEPREIEPAIWHPAPEPSGRDLVLATIREQITNPIKSGLEAVEQTARAPLTLLQRAQTLTAGIASFISAGAAPASPFNARVIGPNRRLAMAEAPVSDFKAIKDSLGGTVNDVVLAAVGGALHRFLTKRGKPTSGLSLRAMVPVSTRDDSQRMALGNRVSNIFVDIPVGPMEATQRLRAISGITRDLKASHQAVGAEAIMNAGSWAPPTLHALAARLISRQRFMNLVVSNVPGPQVPMYLAGARLIVNYPLMPLAETVALSIAVTSLAGVMGFGFTGDWDALPDIEDLATGLSAAIEELKKAARA